jgi:hypothetical protein
MISTYKKYTFHSHGRTDGLDQPIMHFVQRTHSNWLPSDEKLMDIDHVLHVKTVYDILATRSDETITGRKQNTEGF